MYISFIFLKNSIFFSTAQYSAACPECDPVRRQYKNWSVYIVSIDHLLYSRDQAGKVHRLAGHLGGHNSVLQNSGAEFKIDYL